VSYSRRLSGRRQLCTLSSAHAASSLFSFRIQQVRTACDSPRHFFALFDFPPPVSAADGLAFDFADGFNDADFFELFDIDRVVLDDAPVLEDSAVFDDLDESAVLEAADVLVCLTLASDFVASGDSCPGFNFFLSPPLFFARHIINDRLWKNIVSLYLMMAPVRLVTFFLP